MVYIVSNGSRKLTLLLAPITDWRQYKQRDGKTGEGEKPMHLFLLGEITQSE